MLRNEILQSRSNPLAEPLTVEEIMRDEVNPPESVKEFFQILCAGPSGDLSSRKEKLVNSTSTDVVYACSGSKLLPGKHISLGAALKSMAGGKSVVNLSKRFGHCISNEKVRTIHIGMETSLTSSNSLVLDQIIKTPLYAYNGYTQD